MPPFASCFHPWSCKQAVGLAHKMTLPCSAWRVWWVQYILPYGWSWSTGLLLGAILSSTDPVAVVALLKELGAAKNLSTIIEGSPS